MSDFLGTEPYKGVRDFYPEDQAFLNYFKKICGETVQKAGYEEYSASILEPAELYKAKGAENEELVNEQTYTFTDRGERQVTLRPEMTPTVARMVAARRREFGFPLRLFSIPNVFRYERPQRGRLREHWQLNVDLFGAHSQVADAEILLTAYSVLKAFGAKDENFVIKVNNRKTIEELATDLGLNDDQKRQLLRLLDAKDKMGEEKFNAGLAEIGVSPHVFSKGPPAELAQMISDFEAAGIKNIVYAPEIVRGFDYYTGMVFEVFDTHPENKRALFGGGRYDNLTALFDREPLPGVGFGMGDVTLRDFLEVHNLMPAYKPATQIYIAVTDEAYAPDAERYAGELRVAGVNVAVDFGEKKLADQIKTATKHKIPYLIVIGENELLAKQFTLRNLETGEEKTLALSEIPAIVR